MLSSRLLLHVRHALNGRIWSIPTNVLRLESSHSASTGESSVTIKAVNRRTDALQELPSAVPLKDLSILKSHEPSPTVPEQPEDPITVALKRTGSLNELLTFVKQNEKQLEAHHLIHCVNLVFHMERNRRTSVAPDLLHSHIGFISLCRQIRRKAAVFAENDLIKTLKMLSQCKVPGDSRIVQTVLQLVKSRVNDFDLQQITYLHFLLSKFTATPLLDALQMAFPIVFGSQLDSQLQGEDLNQLASALQYAVQEQVPTSKILTHLLQYQGEWEPHLVASIVISLAKLENLDEPTSALVRYLLDILSKCVNEIPFNLLVMTVSRVKQALPLGRISANMTVWYHEQFIETVAKRAILEEWDAKACEVVTRYVIRVGHVNLDFLQYLANLVLRDPNFSDKASVFRVVRAFALANFRPDNLDAIFGRIMKAPLMKMENKELPWIRFLLDCAILGIYPARLLNKILEPTYFAELVRKDVQQDMTQLVFLNRALRVEATNYQGPFPAAELLRQTEVEHKNSPLAPALELAMGGSNYVLHKATTRLGHLIDHVVVLRSGGFPVAINVANEDENARRSHLVEDIQVPRDGKIILIRVHLPEDYAINAPRLRGFASLDNRTLEAMGYTVVSIGTSQWQELAEKERVNYLMRQIVLLNRS